MLSSSVPLTIGPAQGFTLQLNCEPTDLKERFLHCMQELEKYTYLMTDIILATETLDDPQSTRDCTPVLDFASVVSQPLPVTPFNIMDALSEAQPSTSLSCNRCPPEKPKRQKIPKEQQVLIEFSSTSCSQESVMNDKKEEQPVKTEMVAKEVQCNIAEEISVIKTEGTVDTAATEPVMNEQTEAEASACDMNPRMLPAQDILEVDHSYTAMITNVDGSTFWVITENMKDVQALITDMSDYYKKNSKNITKADIPLMSYCAFYDDGSYYRGLLVKYLEDNTVEVYLVDTGECRYGPLEYIQCLPHRFATLPPLARSCHLAGVNLSAYSEEMIQKQEEFMKKYIEGITCTIDVDDNTSESLGVYVRLSSNETLNEVMVREGLLLPIDKPPSNVVRHGPPEEYAVDDDLDINDCPEYEDPVEAVTWFPHSDGWTLDRVPVIGKCKPIPLPAPDTWLRVLVTTVAHFNRLFVQIVNEGEKEKLPSFGTVLPPRTLAGLVRDMNSPASRAAYKPLTVAPAPGELVAALFPVDKNYYRARVRSLSRADQNVELMYVDYGTVMCVKENEVKALQPRWTALPMQAVECVLGGVAPRSSLTHQWAAAKKQLEILTLDKVFNAHVLARDYDEMTVALFDDDGYNVAEKLADQGLVTYEECDVVDDTDQRQRIVVP
ncbi:hypothetical protein K1T71_007076 [Dendrolimus kikuchii]|uniref:Uncharacterized protein n=1 Tax=Dendrolimus kikuchii TaxID=765133 RepID=A0ACC1D108_9NEOP|nr:hypothetical protein K1T71_007076 [Dendrolimus kikuchii]